MATFSLCLLAQAYEQAYNLLQILFVTSMSVLEIGFADEPSAELEMTVNILIQIDKLVQLLESPVFTCMRVDQPNFGPGANHMKTDLRLQLLEPERYPHLYKCLYGLLMLLPQSSAFAALKNRLNSVSSIGYLHIAPRPCVSHPFSPTSQPTSTNSAPSNATTPNLPSFDRPNRLKGREEGIIRWGELLEKFRTVQERARRLQRVGGGGNGGDLDDFNDLRLHDGSGDHKGQGVDGGAGGGARTGRGTVPLVKEPPPPPPKPEPVSKPRSGLGRQFGRLGGAVSGRGKRA